MHSFALNSRGNLDSDELQQFPVLLGKTHLIGRTQHYKRADDAAGRLKRDPEPVQRIRTHRSIQLR